MEGHRVRRGPQPRLGILERIGSQRVLRVAGAVHGDEVDRSLGPPFSEAAVPEGEITQRLDLPNAVLAHVVVLVEATLPPGALLTLGRVVQPRLHHRAAASLRRAAVGSHVDDHLHLRVIEQPAVARAVVAVGEGGLEALDIQAPHAGLTAEDSTEKPHLAVLGEEVNDLVVLRLVDEVAVRVLQAADLVNVLLDRQLVLELLEAGRECGNVAHSALPPACPGRRVVPARPARRRVRLEVSQLLGHICMYCLQKATRGL